jgi:hypothetical protein
MMVGKTRRPSAVITMPVLPIVHHTTYEALREVSPCSAREAAPPEYYRKSDGRPGGQARRAGCPLALLPAWPHKRGRLAQVDFCSGAPAASPEQSPSYLQEGDITQESPHGANLGCSAGWRANWRRCELVPCRILFDAPASWAPLPEAGGRKKESKKILFCTTAGV